MGKDATISWFLARSDVEAVLKIFDRAFNKGYGSSPLEEYIAKYWPQLFSDEAYQQVYKAADEVEARAGNVFEHLRNAWRLKTAVFWLNALQIKDGVGLDFGCSLGYYTCWLQKLSPVKGWHGFDIDELSIEKAEALKEINASEPASLSF